MASRLAPNWSAAFSMSPRPKRDVKAVRLDDIDLAQLRNNKNYSERSFRLVSLNRCAGPSRITSRRTQGHRKMTGAASDQRIGSQSGRLGSEGHAASARVVTNFVRPVRRKFRSASALHQPISRICCYLSLYAMNRPAVHAAGAVRPLLENEALFTFRRGAGCRAQCFVGFGL